MSAAKMKRWVCPDCGAGKLAPSKPRKDDVRRYCLKCSERTGRLVERSCPAVATARARRVESRKAVATRRRAAESQRERERWTVDGMDICAEWKRLCALPVVRERMRDFGVREIPLMLAWSTSRDYVTGRAWPCCERVHLSLYVGCPRHEAQALMAHELAHAILPAREHHGEAWRRMFVLIVCEGWHIGSPSQFKAKQSRQEELHERIEGVLKWRDREEETA